ncbi:inner membrane protein YhjD [Solihabitans fulvus]|uniref:Inner membrane protein YhjD n=1 Tax=Solihabitans fulvus TaxID=1892852 RepID=A0A5B2XNN6_9PSEU|nr:inner membrane protein YhjD [Solihabitans fulvus]KAA2264590.1 inner membrane protein YhjD [Solihabitans fulvus]
MTERTPATKPSLLQRLRERHAWLDHLLCAADQYTEQHGSHYAAAVTYFSVLSLVPLLMIAFAIAGFVLVGQPDLLNQLQASIAKAVPGTLGNTINEAVRQALQSKGTVGVVGLLAAAYSGLGWMSNLREALTAQWGHHKQKPPFLRTVLRDLLALLGLGGALVLSFGITVGGAAFGHTLLELVGLQDTGWATSLLWLLTIVLALLTNWLVFLWVLAKLPREPVSWRSAVRGALVASVGFEILKQVATVYLAKVTTSPAGAAFGPIIGVLVFANLVAQFLLFVTAWTATARDNLRSDPPKPPPPAVIRPVVEVREGPSVGATAGLLGVGAVAGLALRSVLRRR